MLALTNEQGLVAALFGCKRRAAQHIASSRKFDTGLGASDKARDIRTVFEQDKDGDEHRAYGDKFGRRVARRVQDIDENG